ncbi:MAG TPA: tRNA pseudouridine(55) synthase TruB [Gammaproteobacteria bacterium]|nr:tRNA pseudouridine(55) synthase TruB [Gammaproteobacteria bacterium]
MTHVRSPSRDVFGLLLLDKPLGLSSNRALQRVKRLYAAEKAGHAGSLDPLATGMLPIFFGAATRLAAFMLEARKTYRVTARLGSATTTGDAEGETIEERRDGAPPAPAVISAAVSRFVGEIEQVPPMYSALKRGGVPLYRLARSGVEVERSPRRVVIEALVVERYDWPELTLHVRCSKGTYVRTLVEDIARAAGTLGHVAGLRRLAVSPFPEGAMRTFEEIEAAAIDGGAALDGLLLSADAGLEGWPSARLGPAEVAKIAHGQAVAADPALPCGHVKVYGESGRLIAIGLVTEERSLAPTRVFLR